jgi:hypothetical protein
MTILLFGRLLPIIPKQSRIICRDDKPVLWVIDPVEKRILSTINFPGGGMEDLGLRFSRHILDAQK